MISQLFTKLHRIVNFPFFIGIMMFLVPMAYFREETPWNFQFIKDESIDAWKELRDDDCGLLFAAMLFLVTFKSIDDAFKAVSFQNKE